MRTIKTLIFLLLFHAPVLRAQFEGLISMQARSYSETETTTVAYTMSVKNDMLSIITTGGAKDAQGGSFIIRGDKRLMWIINDEGKSYVEFPLIDDTSTSTKAPPKELKPAGSRLTKTGKTKKILGYACDEYVGSTDEETSTIWASSKLGKVYDGLFKSLNQLNRADEAGSAGGDWQADLVKLKVFPLSITTRRNDVVAETQDVLSIATKSMPHSVFEPPAGYTKQSMQNQFEEMMKQMQEKMKSEGGEKKDSSGG